jgi:hypothetical protein
VGLVFRTAMLGGTFDPIHRAHLDIAWAAADRFDLAKFCSFPPPIHLTSPGALPRPGKIACAWWNWPVRSRRSRIGRIDRYGR